MTITDHSFSARMTPRSAAMPPPMPSQVRPQPQTQPRAPARAEAFAILANTHLVSFGKSGTTRAFCPYRPLRSPEVSCTPPAPTTACLLDRRRAFSHAPRLPCSHPCPAAHSLPFSRVSPRLTRSSTSPASIRPGVGCLHSRSSPSCLPLRKLRIDGVRAAATRAITAAGVVCVREFGRRQRWGQSRKETRRWCRKPGDR
ncbi:hypothetical protein DFH08DRAFT_331766 [Mycena albidolilacea]|uniref:Uncharacterized protein n=1 Tax=Mycena albidolilacea TaxID=1033008 RepID=A0AAD6ZK40_9AGAR|nr:hypothetical protein DFH08DRAFT_331766 [Mycena albidolilacea]